MPILWRYLLSHYLRVFFFCSIAFIAILLTMRLNEIAHFATLGAEGIYIILFTLYQIPYILPIAIPIACLISAVLLIKRLSDTHELTALRASGISISSILTPILFAASIVTLGNLYITSELATNSHLSAGMLKSELRALNPLLLLNNKHLMRLKGYYVDTLGVSQSGENAADVLIGIPNKNSGRITLLISKNLQATPFVFAGKEIALISTLPNKNAETEEQFDQLIVENIAHAATTIQDFSQMVQKKVWTLNNDHLKLPLLLTRIADERHNLQQAIETGKSVGDQKQIQRNLNRAYSEIIRRISLGFSAFTFTLMGASFGVGISRNSSNRGLIYLIILTLLFLVGYFTAKGIEHLLIASSLLYLIPHVVIIFASLWTLKRATKGIE